MEAYAQVNIVNYLDDKKEYIIAIIDNGIVQVSSKREDEFPALYIN